MDEGLFDTLSQKADSGELLPRGDLLEAAQQAGMPRALADDIIDAILYVHSTHRESVTVLCLFRDIVDAYTTHHPRTP